MAVKAAPMSTRSGLTDKSPLAIAQPSVLARFEIRMERDARIETAEQAATMANEALLFVPLWDGNDDQLDALVPGHVFKTEAAQYRLVAHSGDHP